MQSDSLLPRRSYDPKPGQVLRLLRRERGLTQADLADRFGLTPGYVASIERGERQPSLAVAVMLEHWTGGILPVRSWAEAEFLAYLARAAALDQPQGRRKCAAA